MVWLALWYAAVALIISVTRQTRAWGFAGVAAWMGLEWLCARAPWGGFGWGRLAYTAPGTLIDGLFPIISATGVSLVIVVTGFALAWLVWPVVSGERPLTLRSLQRLPIGVVAGLLVISAGGGLLGRMYDPAPDGGEVTVAVVQGNVPGLGLDALGPRYSVEHNHLAETIILAAQICTGQVQTPDFVVWPENSTATDPYTDRHTAQAIRLAVDLVGMPILVGVITNGPGDDERQVTSLWWTPDQSVTATYSKRNLVPFGEWIPVREFFLDLIPDLAYVGRQSIPGTGPGVFDVTVDGRRLQVGFWICYEVAYDATVDDVFLPKDRPGAQVVVEQTSNAWATGSDQIPHQQKITQVRAMESRREILLATTNSHTGWIDSHGVVVYQSTMRASDVQVFTVPLRSHITPAIACRAGFDVASILLPLLGCLGVAVLYFVRRGTRNRLEASPPEAILDDAT
jgi:apolipoprotein N-acyltransferase